MVEQKTKKRIMRKIAVPTLDGKLSAHFGQAENFTIFGIEDNKIVSETVLDTPEHLTGSYPNFIAQNGATDIIIGGVGKKAIDIFNSHNITVYAGKVKKASEVVEDLLAGKLSITGKSCKGEGDGPEFHLDGDHHNHGHHNH